MAPVKGLLKKSKRKSHLLTIGNREIETHGLDTGFWRDLYHRSLTVYWPVFFGTAAAIFVTLNAVFAFFYWLGDRPIANVSDDLPLSLTMMTMTMMTKMETATATTTTAAAQ
jgi:hypothetical protein